MKKIRKIWIGKKKQIIKSKQKRIDNKNKTKKKKRQQQGKTYPNNCNGGRGYGEAVRVVGPALLRGLGALPLLPLLLRRRPRSALPCPVGAAPPPRMRLREETKDGRDASGKISQMLCGNAVGCDGCSRSQVYGAKCGCEWVLEYIRFLFFSLFIVIFYIVRLY